MKQYDHPLAQDLHLPCLLYALSDPFRLEVVCKLALCQPQPCAPLQDGRPKSSVSHHFSVLRKAGVIRTEVVGVTHMNSLRAEELEARFPGVLAAIVAAARAEQAQAQAQAQA